MDTTHDINYHHSIFCTQFGITKLHIAAAENDSVTMQSLLQHNADINARTMATI